MTNVVDTVRKVLKEFCLEFVADPYLCYTEHGLHALFYSKLFNALPNDQRYTNWRGRKVCVIQKEYRTAANLGKSQRQHWDICVIKTPPQSLINGPESYDYLVLAAVVEFGLNEAEQHLVEDVRRLCHKDANLEQRFAVHLYRLSERDRLFSKRDWVASWSRILLSKRAAKLTAKKPVEVYYAMHDSTGQHPSGVWLIKQGDISLLE